MAKLDETLETIVQRTGSTTGSPRNAAEAAAFRNGVRLDVAAIADQLNNVHYPLFDALSKENQLDALDFGLSGNVIFTHIQATAADADAYWDSSRGRTRTLKETVDVLLGEIARLENEIDVDVDAASYDDGEVRSLIGNNQLNLQQLVKDTHGTNYTLDNDGAADLTYSLAQAVDAIGTFFGGFPGTGNTYVGTYPTLTLAVNLSDVVLDTTVPQSTITSLPGDLTNIRTFTGMTDSSDSSPTYSAHGALTNILDGDDLELAVYKLDAAIGSATGAFATAANITSNSPGDPTSDDLVFGSTTLDDAGTAAHDHRLFFDKSKAALRAGSVPGTEWDDINRGDHSIGFGEGSTVSGAHSSVLGGSSHTVAGTFSLIGGGSGNQISAGSLNVLVGGASNTITAGFDSFLGGGDSNVITVGNQQVLVGGQGNNITSGSQTVLVGGNTNRIGLNAAANGAFIGGGITNQVDRSSYSSVVGGQTNKIGATAAANYAGIFGGQTNSIDGSGYSFIGGGSDHVIDATAGWAVIAGGYGHNVTGGGSGVFTGTSNSITDSASVNSAIVTGQNNQITGSEESVICGGGSATAGNRNEINKSDTSFIGSGEQNQILGNVATNHDFHVIGGGINNVIGNASTDFAAAFIGGGNSHSITGVSSYAVIAGGTASTITGGLSAAIGGGDNNSVTANYAAIPGGRDNVVSQPYGVATGYAASGEHHGVHAHSAGSFSTTGDSQEEKAIWRNQTTDATQTELFLDGSSLQYIMEDSTTYAFNIMVVGRQTGGAAGTAGDSWYEEVKACAEVTGGVSAGIAGGTQTTISNSAGATWSVAVDIDTATDALRIRVTGELNKNINWTATARVVKVQG